MFKIEKDLVPIETYFLLFIIFSISLLNISKYIPPPLIIQLSCCSATKSRLTFCDPMDCKTPGFLSFTISQSLLKVMSTESVMPVNHLILYCPLLLLTSIFSSIRVFSNESALNYLCVFRSQFINQLHLTCVFFPSQRPPSVFYFFNSNQDHLCPSILFVQKSFFSQACCLRRCYLLSFDQQICSLF